MFKLSHDVLARLCANNRFPIPTSGMVFVGLRGATPRGQADGAFVAAAELDAVDVDYRHARCTLVQWKPADQTISAFPGSTVPHATVMAPEHSDQFNQIFTGYYSQAYQRGVHRPGSPNAHRAFIENRDFMIVRTHDDTVFDAAFDPVTKAFPGDNLHAAWCGIDGAVGHYSSQGCQVVVGFPDTIDGHRSASGPWMLFKDNGYATQQNIFDYLLVAGSEAALAANAPDTQTRRLRFGSQGEEVTALQTALIGSGDFVARPDTDFGPQTLLALLAFQRRVLAQPGVSVDGIAGPRVFAALGLRV